MFSFLFAWITSRRYWLFPALLPLGIALVVCIRLAVDAQRPQFGVAQTYINSAEEAIKEQQWERADLLLRRALTINPRSPKAQSLLATMSLEKKEYDKAAYWIERVATGYDVEAAKANIWLASRALGTSQPPSPENVQTAVRYLDVARKIQPNNVEIRIALAAAYVRLGIFKEAIEHYTACAETYPELNYDLARLYDHLGMIKETHASAAMAVTAFKNKLDQDPYDWQTRDRCADSLVLMWQYPQACELLLAGLRLGQHVDEMKARVSEVYAAWSKHVVVQRSTTESPLPMLQEALKWNPQNMAACLQLLEMVRENSNRPEAREILEKSLTRGEASSLTHLILGTCDLIIGNHESAQIHLEQARALDQGSPAILNNLACVILLTDDGTKLESALILSNSALELAPDVPEIRETRGQVLLKLGRYREALVDLEAVLPIYTNRLDLSRSLPDVHAALAEIYDVLNQPSLASQHRAKVEELKSRKI